MGVFLKIENSIAIIEFDLPDSKVNLMTADVIRRLDGILDDLKDQEALDAVLVVSRKKGTFIAGADIKEIETITDPKDGEAKSCAGQRVLDKLEDLTVPTVAVINGVAVGGGCELVLACRYRVATFSEKVKIGFPEVNLGIIPGFGGTYRLPRTVGLMSALKLITSGKPVSAQSALKMGLLDALFPDTGLEEQVRRFVEKIKTAPDAVRKPRKKGFDQVFWERTAIGRFIVCSQTRKTILKLTKGFYPAPIKAVDVIEKTIRFSRSEALAIETAAFAELAVTATSKNLVKLFYLSEKYRKLAPKEMEGVVPKEINKCAVVGAGIMGGGIAQILAYKDISVRVKDIQYGAIAQGLKTADKIFRQAVKRRKLTPAEAAVKMSRISGTLDYSGFKTSDMLIEAVVEDMNVKKKVFKELSGVVSPDTVICTNTSALSVAEMARETGDASRVIGLHFFNPVHRMPLVEIIKTEMTSAKTIATTIGLSKRLGKIPVLVKDSRGFLVNRILLAYINEAGRILEETGEIESIDQAVREFGMPMGPFELSDEVGLDVGIKVLHVLQEAFGDRFRPPVVFEEIYKKGILGKKTAKGFYIHSKKRRLNGEVMSLLTTKKSTKPFDKKICLDRMIYIMVNEAARCLEEGVVDDAGGVDIGMVMGTGFPAFRGGLLRYADHIGIAHVVAGMESLNRECMDGRFQPCRYLLDLKEKNGSFYA